jgi:hypothetical protein
MAKTDQTESVIVWEESPSTQTKPKENVTPHPAHSLTRDHVIRVLEPKPGGQPLRITQISSGFGNPCVRSKSQLTMRAQAA